MRSRLGHHVVWYVGMNVLKEQAGSVFTGICDMEAVHPDRNLGTHESEYTSP
jgi:hypothetical protein